MIDNYAPINLGQLKNVAKPFYQRLRQMGFDTNKNLKDYGYPPEWTSLFPWLESTPPAENYLPANIGQLKAVFAFEYVTALIPPDVEGRDSDGDGIADVDEPPGDFDGDGLENWEDADRDNDGVNDSTDFFPDDDRRSENIPVKYYGVIDLSQYSYPNGDPAAATDPQHIAINDEGQVSWVTSVPSPGGSTYTITKWNNGTLSNPETLHDFSNTTNSEDGQSIQELVHNITNLKGDGTWIGSITDSNYAQHFSTGQPATGHWQRVRGMPGHLAVPPSLLLTFDPALTDPEDNSPYVDGNGGNKVIVEHVTPAGTPIGSLIYNIRDDGGYSAITRVFRGSPSGPYSHPEPTPNERWFIHGISSAGDVLLSRRSEVNIDLNGDADTLWDSLGTVTHLGRVGARSVNAQRQVVGTQTVEGYVNGVLTLFNGNDPRGELGFLWENGQLKTFHDLLPEKFRKQLRSTVPYFISNVNENTGVVQILFDCESLEDQDGSASWIPRTLSLYYTASGEAWIETVDALGDHNSDGSMVRRAIPGVAINKHGTMVHAPSEGVPRLLFPIEFRADDALFGFDLPIKGDWNQKTLKSDDSFPEWWTSIGMDPGMENPKPKDKNDNIHLRFNDGPQLPPNTTAPKPGKHAAFVINEAGNASDLITLPQAFPTLPALSSDTKFTMTVNVSASVPRDNPIRVQIAVRSARKPNPANGDDFVTTPVAKLDVDILPIRRVPLKVWYLKDASAPACPVGFQKPNDIVAFLNETYRQACIEFYLEPGGEKEFDFDVPSSNQGQPVAPDGRLDTGNPFSVEWLKVNNAETLKLLPAGGLNLVLVDKFTTTRYLGVTVPPSPDHGPRF